MITAAVTTEQHYWVSRDGQIFVDGSEDYAFFARYLEVFDEVIVLSRARRRGEPIPARAKRVDGPRVRFHALPDFRGLGEALSRSPRFFAAIDAFLREHPGALYVLRPEGATSLAAHACLRLRGLPYVVELVTDPYDSLTPRAFGSPWVLPLRGPLTAAVRAMCGGALAVSYVTEGHLQRRYPARDEDLQFACPDGDIDPSLFAYAERALRRIEGSPRRLSAPTLFMLGRVDRPFKGVDLALEALTALVSRGYAPRLRLAGGGALLEHYRALSRKLGVEGRVDFLDERSDRAGLFAEMSEADLFVLPTRREGLPRALLEAMAMGLPCVASEVAGIPELLPGEALFPPEDVGAFVACVVSMLESREARLAASRRNHAVSRRFAAEDLGRARRAFYQKAKELRLALPT